MEKIKKAYYLLFYKLYLFFNSLSDDGWAAWKAGLIIQTLQLFILTIIFLMLEMITKESMIPNIDPKIWAIPLAIILAIFNYYFFLHKDRWKIHEWEFNEYSEQKNRLINFIVFFIVFGILGILIFTFYQYSQIDWQYYN